MIISSILFLTGDMSKLNSKLIIENKARELGMVYKDEVVNYKDSEPEKAAKKTETPKNTAQDGDKQEIKENTNDTQLEQYTIEVKSGESLDVIARNLKEQKIIKDMAAFKSKAYAMEASKKLRDGIYKFEPNTDLETIIKKLMKGN